MKGKYASIEVTNFTPIVSLALLMENAFIKCSSFRFHKRIVITVDERCLELYPPLIS